VRQAYGKFGPIQIDVSMEKGGFVAKVLVFPVSETGECKDIPYIPYEGRDVNTTEALKRLAENAGVDWSSVWVAVNGGGK
jgi:hypothetical protein